MRFRDMDPQRHLNNAVYATYFETGRVAMFRAPDLSAGVANATFVLARPRSTFFAKCTGPAT